ncbi:hypothetical protein ENSA7_49750 [Enhygromyxa salina]|uniref:Uncharacterized protein n=1 Tax=Enhygromyxa salina TaxID=215803 RepID=A0A2S9YIC7_9BACT|nr:hypothetical protein ENSA7_49750 [Enhygromyxa salina]
MIMSLNTIVATAACFAVSLLYLGAFEWTGPKSAAPG